MRKDETKRARLVVPEDLLTDDQKTLRMLCTILLVWAWISFGVTELGILVDEVPLFSILGNPSMLLDFAMASAVPALILAFGVMVAILGYRGVANPRKITPFFTIIFVEAMLVGWDLASKLSLGMFDPVYVAEAAVVIGAACFAWRVKEATYPDDWFERKEAARAQRKAARKAERASRRELRGRMK